MEGNLAKENPPNLNCAVQENVQVEHLVSIVFFVVLLANFGVMEFNPAE